MDMNRCRLRIRFRKEDDLRFIGHRDLVRLFERLFRRAEFPLAMSQGFHPKPRMTFPSALAVGIVGRDEVMEVALAEQVEPQALVARLRPLLPEGLSVHDVTLLDAQDKKAQVWRVSYSVSLPDVWQARAVAAVAQFLKRPSIHVHRSGKAEPIDLRVGVQQLRCTRTHLEMTLRADAAVQVRPREVLAELGLGELETKQGCYLVRTSVDLKTAGGSDTTTTHQLAREQQTYEKGNPDQCLAAGRMPDCDR